MKIPSLKFKKKSGLQKPVIKTSLFDFKKLASDFRQLNPKDVGTWPAAPKVVVLTAAFLVALVAGGWFVWAPQYDVLEARRNEEIKLRDEFKIKKSKAINLDLYKEQLTEIDRTFGALLKQLPNKSEVDALLIEINQAGLGRGLQFELFKPGQEVKKDFYAELPITVKLTGSYHDLGAFAADIAALSRIVTINNMVISTKGDEMTLDAITKTFRYLDAEEQVKSKKDAKTSDKKAATKDSKGDKK